MSTNSMIGILNSDGTVEAIYCHWDGYPEGVGATLSAHYTTEDKIRELVSLGNISSLGQSCVAGRTVAYHRDRTEEWVGVEPRTYGTEVDYYRRTHQPYVYLWKGTKWFVNCDDLDKHLSEVC